MSPVLLLLFVVLVLLQGTPSSLSIVSAATNTIQNSYSTNTGTEDVDPTITTTTTTRKRRPNVIVLLTDDQDLLITGINHMPKLQKHLQQTPGGITFNNAFVHTPICCPSRSSILTGRYLHNVHVRNNSLEGNCYGSQWRDEIEKQSSIAVHAKEAGYTTYYAGKYLNRYGEDVNGYQVPPGWDKWLGLVGNSVYYNYTLVHSEDGGRTVDSRKHGDNYSIDYLPDVLLNQTLQWIDEHKDADINKPFLLFLAWPTPHDPFTPAPWASGLFSNSTFVHPPNFNAPYLIMQQKHWLLRQLPSLNATHIQQFIHHIYRLRLRSLQSVDRHIEMIVELLEQYRLLDRSYIFYTSDNGYQLGQHRMALDKRHLYEHDIRVPFIVRVPTNNTQKRNKKNNITSSQEIILNVDIAPTIYDIVYGGQRPIPNDMDGISILPLLSALPRPCGGRRQRRDFLISYHGESNGPCGLANCPMPSPPWYMPDAINNTYRCLRTIIQDKDKQGDDVGGHHEDSIYCRFHDDESFIEYYDLETNPYQLDNQYYSKLNPIQKQRYEQRLHELLHCKGVSCRQQRDYQDKEM